MTIMSTSGTQRTIDETVRLAYVLAGLLEENQSLAAVGGGGLARLFLDTIVKGLQAKGITAKASGFYNLTLTANTFQYTMPSNVLDVFGDGVYIDASETDVTRASSETNISQMSADEWNAQSAKDATGRPIRYFCFRETNPPVVRLWPIPDEAGTVRLQIHRHLSDTTDGAATLDLEAYWIDYILYSLATMLAEAKTMPPDKIGRLNGMARSKLNDARAMSSGRTGSQMVVTHGSSRRQR